MTIARDERDDLIEAITREVLAVLAAPGDACIDCKGACAAHCSDKVRDVVTSGASRIAYHGQAADVPRDLARYIDHTLLRPDASAADIDRLCTEAKEYRFAAVCINPTWVRRAAGILHGTDVAVASVIGFPFGANTSDIKAMEARRAIRDGAREIDMVINIGALKSGMYDLVREDIARVSDACHEAGAASKVIIEAALLTDEEKVIACRPGGCAGTLDPRSEGEAHGVGGGGPRGRPPHRRCGPRHHRRSIVDTDLVARRAGGRGR